MIVRSEETSSRTIRSKIIKLVKDENGNVVNGAAKYCLPLRELWGSDFLPVPRMFSKDNRANLDLSKIYSTVWLMGLSHVNLSQLHPIL